MDHKISTDYKIYDLNEKRFVDIIGRSSDDYKFMKHNIDSIKLKSNKQNYVHRFIAEVGLQRCLNSGNCEEVDHIDNIKYNNHPSNLRVLNKLEHKNKTYNDVNHNCVVALQKTTGKVLKFKNKIDAALATYVQESDINRCILKRCDAVYDRFGQKWIFSQKKNAVSYSYNLDTYNVKYVEITNYERQELDLAPNFYKIIFELNITDIFSGNNVKYNNITFNFTET
jgi:hypothetical protein